MKSLILLALGLLMVCFYGCKKDESDPLEVLTKDLTTGTWHISELTINDNEVTDQYGKYRLIFTLEKDTESPQELFNRLLLNDNSNTFRGTWIFIATGPEEEYKHSVSIAFINNNEFQDISARWYIQSHAERKLVLIKQAEELSPDTRLMVLEKQ